VGNAVKFTSQGYVEIKVQIANKTKDSVDLNFSVSDTGIGISTENIDKIFDSFSQASSDVTRKFGGTGLGLTITKRLLELQGSHIQVESHLGKGTKFYFTLGFKIGQPSESRGNRWQINTETGQRSLQGVRILLAEDNAMNVLVASKFLNKWGVTLKVAENGEEALNKVKESVFDLVLMDLQMPEMDGYQACIEIKKSHPDLPIIALTASATTETQEKVFKAGMSDFITKPFNPNELFQVIAKNYQRRDTLISDR
jgi:CheY-like chemotaxis protein